MYVPGNDDRKLAKIPQLGADCICLDCEDGVAIGKKEEARKNIRRVLDERHKLDYFGKSECSVRVNSVGSGMCKADLNVVLGGENLPDAIHLPKVDDAEELTWFVQRYNNALASSKNEDTTVTVGLIMFVESARALMRLPEICTMAEQLKMMSNLVPEALVFGSDDFVADIGATRTTAATELLYARQKIVAVAKAFELQAIDLVHIDYKDLDGLKLYSEEGARMGFTGKQVIHPGQVPVVQKAFSPSDAKVEWATNLGRDSPIFLQFFYLFFYLFSKLLLNCF
jgi:citrate lyase subunit beta-like protein